MNESKDAVYTVGLRSNRALLCTKNRHWSLHWAARLIGEHHLSLNGVFKLLVGVLIAVVFKLTVKTARRKSGKEQSTLSTGSATVTTASSSRTLRRCAQKIHKKLQSCMQYQHRVQIFKKQLRLWITKYRRFS